ncbi:MAG: radical SAM protein [Spirochaetes bacterium]|nr:radical SAM protein [Spirochaetota bacterium]
MESLRDKILQKYIQSNRPFSVLFEVTKRCMCKCIHCYLADNSDNELSLKEIKDLFIQLKNIGVVNLGLTGGEPFLRKDIFEIIKYAYENHFFISILTTGILLDSEKIKLLKSYNVNQFEISILGAKAETHDKIMNYKGAFDKTIENINLLKKENAIISLKATIIKQNYKELVQMANIAKEFNVEFKANINIAPKTDGNKITLNYMLNEEELNEIDLKLINGGLIPGEDYSGGALLTCNAGKLSIGISSNGEIYPCLLFRKSIGNIRKKSLQDILIKNPSNFLKKLRKIKEEDVKRCYKCNIKKYCNRCPGISYLETKKIASANPSACYIANLVFNKISKN